MNMAPLGESGILLAMGIGCPVTDVMVMMPLGWKLYRGADKSFILCDFRTGALPNSRVPPLAISGQSQVLAFSPGAPE